MNKELLIEYIQCTGNELKGGETAFKGSDTGSIPLIFLVKICIETSTKITVSVWPSKNIPSHVQNYTHFPGLENRFANRKIIFKNSRLCANPAYSGLDYKLKSLYNVNPFY